MLFHTRRDSHEKNSLVLSVSSFGLPLSINNNPTLLELLLPEYYVFMPGDPGFF
jgi:hypothetical protein